MPGLHGVRAARPGQDGVQAHTAPPRAGAGRAAGGRARAGGPHRARRSAGLTAAAGCTPRRSAVSTSWASSSCVVTCVISARFLTRPQLSPSGVSAGHSMPHWLGCSARGPDTWPAPRARRSAGPPRARRRAERARRRRRRRHGHQAPQQVAPPAGAGAAAMSCRAAGGRQCGCAPQAACSRAHLARLLELAADARHHAQRRDERQPRQHLRGPARPGTRAAGRSASSRRAARQGARGAGARRAAGPGGMAGGAAPRLADALALHAEALDGPVAAADRALHAQRDDLRPDVLGGVKVGRALGQVLLRLRAAPAWAGAPGRRGRLGLRCPGPGSGGAVCGRRSGRGPPRPGARLRRRERVWRRRRAGSAAAGWGPAARPGRRAAGAAHQLVQLLVHALEQVLEQQRQQAARELQALVAVVVPVVDLARVHHGLQHAPHHLAQVRHLRARARARALVMTGSRPHACTLPLASLPQRSCGRAARSHDPPCLRLLSPDPAPGPAPGACRRARRRGAGGTPARRMQARGGRAQGARAQGAGAGCRATLYPLCPGRRGAGRVRLGQGPRLALEGAVRAG